MTATLISQYLNSLYPNAPPFHLANCQTLVPLFYLSSSRTGPCPPIADLLSNISTSCTPRQLLAPYATSMNPIHFFLFDSKLIHSRKRPKFRFGSVRFGVRLILAGSVRFGSAKILPNFCRNF